MTKKEAIEHVGGRVKALAEALGISANAIYMWDEQKPIPREHELRLRYEIPPAPAAAKAA